MLKASCDKFSAIKAECWQSYVGRTITRYSSPLRRVPRNLLAIGSLIRVSYFFSCSSPSRSALYTRSPYNPFDLSVSTLRSILTLSLFNTSHCVYLTLYSAFLSRYYFLPSFSSFFSFAYISLLFSLSVSLFHTRTHIHIHTHTALCLSLCLSYPSPSPSFSRSPSLLRVTQERIWLNPLERFSRWRAVAQAATIRIYDQYKEMKTQKTPGWSVVLWQFLFLAAR